MGAPGKDEAPALLGGAGRALSEDERIERLEQEMTAARLGFARLSDAICNLARAIATMQATLIALADQLPGEEKPEPEGRRAVRLRGH